MTDWSTDDARGAVQCRYLVGTVRNCARGDILKGKKIGGITLERTKLCNLAVKQNKINWRGSTIIIACYCVTFSKKSHFGSRLEALDSVLVGRLL